MRKAYLTSTVVVVLAGCTAPGPKESESIGEQSAALSADRTEGGTATGTGTACNTSAETVDKVYDNLMTSTTFSKKCL